MNGMERAVGESIEVIESDVGLGGVTGSGPDGDQGRAERSGNPNPLTVGSSGDGGSQSAQDERKSRKRFNPSLDVILLREVGSRQPYAAPHGKVNETWEEVTNALNDSGQFPWKVDSRMARDRFVILEKWLKKHDMENLRRGAGEVFELREHLLTDVCTRKDQITAAKEEKRGDRDGKEKSIGERKRDYIGDPDDPEVKRAREMETLSEFISYMKEKDNALIDIQRKRDELDSIRIQADIQDREKQRELEDKRLQLENAKLKQASEERKLLYQILHAVSGTKNGLDDGAEKLGAGKP